MAIQSFSHVGVCVSDLERATAFYREVLGFRELFTMTFGDELAATMEVDGCRFESRMLARDDVRVELLHWLEPPVEGAGPAARRAMTAVGMTHLCFRVDSLDDLLDAAERHGGGAHHGTLSVLQGVGEGGGDVRVVYATDPDGTRIEFMEGSPDLAGL